MECRRQKGRERSLQREKYEGKENEKIAKQESWKKEGRRKKNERIKNKGKRMNRRKGNKDLGWKEVIK